MTTNTSVGRNEPCPCGSGLKHKACCGRNETAAATDKRAATVIYVVGALAVAALIAWRAWPDGDAEPAAGAATDGTVTTSGSTPAAASQQPGAITIGTDSAGNPITMTPAAGPPPGMAGAPGAGTPQPPGPPPPGKVWAPDHGHWHDDPAAMGAMTLTPGADGNVTVQGTTGEPTAMPVTPGTPTPQPPGPPPPGKVWAPDHGHWHDDPAAMGATLPAAGAGATPLTITPGGSAQTVGTLPPTPGTMTPQPPGPPPPGKVWAPDHGHWHDAPPAGAPTITPVPAPTSNP